MAKYAKISTVVFSWLNVMPRWLLLLITGSIASTVISFLHAGEEAKVAKEKAAKGEKVAIRDTPEWAREQEAEAAREAAEAAKAAGAGTSSGVKASKVSSSSPAKKRKGKK